MNRTTRMLANLCFGLAVLPARAQSALKLIALDTTGDAIMYRYQVVARAGAPRSIATAEIDVAAPKEMQPPTILGTTGKFFFDALATQFDNVSLSHPPLSMDIPPGWFGGINTDGRLFWWGEEKGGFVQKGMMVAGFTIKSSALPALRKWTVGPEQKLEDADDQTPSRRDPSYDKTSGYALAPGWRPASVNVLFLRNQVEAGCADRKLMPKSCARVRDLAVTLARSEQSQDRALTIATLTEARSAITKATDMSPEVRFVWSRAVGALLRRYGGGDPPIQPERRQPARDDTGQQLPGFSTSWLPPSYNRPIPAGPFTGPIMVATEADSRLQPRQLSVEVWYRTPDRQQRGSIMFLEMYPPERYVAPYAAVWFRLNTPNKSNSGLVPAFSVSNGGTYNNFVPSSGVGSIENSLQLSTWYHLVATDDGREARIYVNGELGGRLPVSGEVVYGATDVRIAGMRNASGSNYAAIDYQRVPGDLRMVKLHARAMTPAEIRANFQRGVPTSAQAPANTEKDEFPAVTSRQALAEYTDTNDDPAVVAANAVSQQGAGLHVVANKWILERALGRGPVLITHPRSPDLPGIYRVRSSAIGVRYQVRAHGDGDGSIIQFWANGRMLAERAIPVGQWVEGTVAIPRGIGEVEVRHIATGWGFEYLYWSELGPVER